MKSFPVNGWALDFYEAAPGALNAVISAGAGTALLFVFYKTSAFYPALFRTAGAYLGLAGFLLSNLMALNQKNEKRMLGYSSVATIGLILFILLAFEKEYVLLGAGLFIVNHILVKSGLFFTAHTDRKLPGIIPLLLSAALAGFPPFPGFWAKWQIIRILGQDGAILPVIVVLLGSLFEVVYLFRWAAGKSNREESRFIPGFHGNMAVIVLSAAVSAGIAAAVYLNIVPSSFILIFLVPMLFLFLDFLPQKVKGFLALAVTAAAVYMFYLQIWFREPVFSIRFIFFILISAGALIHLFASMYKKGDSRAGYYPAFMLTVFGLMGVLVSTTAIQFLSAWEAMALGSYFLVVKGRRGEGPSLLYIAFSAAGAYLIMAGLAIEPYFPFLGGFSTIAAPLCILLGILMKTGIIGFHVWLPGSYSESDDDASSFLSSTLSKITVFALIALLAALGTGSMRLFQQSLGYWIGWAGVITAFAATLAAVYQEDIKYLLAYSSIGQLGYIVLAAGIADHAGWTAVMYLTVNHFLFKGMLFLAVAGIVYRTGTRLMYQMGGLIKKMPVSFISVLMAIIALSGVPPLSGFGSKWLVYTALLEKGWYLHLALAMFTSTIAFLYLFRLIHAMFLGQPKPEHNNLTEAPVWLIIPQVILMAALMGFSMFPGLVLKPVQAAVSRYFPQSAVWTGSTLNNLFGYWDGTLVMYITMGIFMVFLFWLLFIMRKPVSVKQFNIVFAAERPEKPATTHYAYNFFSPYRKALGVLSRPYGFAAWRWITGAAESVGGVFRRFYTGNGQTYALHIILFAGILFFVLFGAFYG